MQMMLVSVKQSESFCCFCFVGMSFFFFYVVPSHADYHADYIANCQSADIFAVCSGAGFVGCCDENSDDTSCCGLTFCCRGLVICSRLMCLGPNCAWAGWELLSTKYHRKCLHFCFNFRKIYMPIKKHVRFVQISC